MISLLVYYYYLTKEDIFCILRIQKTAVIFTAILHGLVVKKGANMKSRRYTVDLSPTLDDLLSSLAVEKGTTKAEIIRRSLATYSHINNEQKNGVRSVTVDGQNNIKQVIVL